ncbi:MAG: hypothetical protein EB025_03870, partial [Chitinophagaceae bacterium]|nr:hypothetical protein [Chitinophagaceae bacterium]
MFALGGVQNGCTTMVAVVSPQGSQDPIEAVQELNKMVELQNAGLNIVEEAKSDVYEQIPINY